MRFVKPVVLIAAVAAGSTITMAGGRHVEAGRAGVMACMGAGSLHIGQSLRTVGFQLVMQADGDLVAMTGGGRPLWASQTSGPGVFAALQASDGNLVVYSATDVPLWTASVPRSPGDQLCMQADGNLVVYSHRLVALWAAESGPLFPIGQTTSSNGYPSSQCTWAAEQEAYFWTNGLYPRMGGNADTWYSAASANGWAVGTAPRIGSIVVFQPWVDGAGAVGHVAWVTEVYPRSRSITVVERNFQYPGHDNVRTIRGPTSPFGNDSSKLGYIYMNP